MAVQATGAKVAAKVRGRRDQEVTMGGPLDAPWAGRSIASLAFFSCSQAVQRRQQIGLGGADARADQDRKLGATSRREAVNRARRLGLR